MEQKDATERKRKGIIHAFTTLILACVLTLGTALLTTATNPTTTTTEYSLKLYPTIDTTIDQTTPEKNYNNSSALIVSNTFGNNSSGWQRDILLYFDFSLLPTYTQIKQATLSLYYYDYDETDPADRMISIHRITDTWDMNHVTWKTRPTTTQANVSYTSVPITPGWMTWDITTDIQQIIQSPSTYHGWQLSDKNPWRDINIPIIKFKSTETQTGYQPYLDLDYTIPLMISTNGPYTAYITENISFNSTIIDGGVPPYSWHWDFGDDTTSPEQNTIHAYTVAGTHTVSLTVSDTYGETTTIHTSATIKENTTEPYVSIQHPQNGLYFGNKKIASLQKPWIIGPIEVTVYTKTTYPIKKVKFLLDNQIQSIDTTAPYSWTWNQRTIPGKHTIKVIIVDDNDASAVDTLTVWKIF